MKRVNIHDADTNLSRYIAELAPGETILPCNRNEPIAELKALGKSSKQGVRIRVMEGRLEVPNSFFEPLPEELLKFFNGEGPLYNADPA